MFCYRTVPVVTVTATKTFASHRDGESDDKDKEDIDERIKDIDELKSCIVMLCFVIGQFQ